MNTPDDDLASVADRSDLTLGPLPFGRVDAEHNLAVVAGAFGAIGKAS